MFLLRYFLKNQFHGYNCKSQKTFLEYYDLGGRCYHGYDTLFGTQADVDFWLRVANGNNLIFLSSTFHITCC